MEEPAIEEGDNHRDVEVAPALISVHPDHKFVVVSIGSELRVFDLQGVCSVTLVGDSSGPLHKDSIRAIRFGAEGKLFLSAGDDKLVKIWNANSWHCISTVLVLEVFRKGPMAMVQRSLYVMSHGIIFKQGREVKKVVVSASEFRRRIGFAMTGLRDGIYVIGGVIGPDKWNWDIKPLSDVDVLTIGSKRPAWRQVSPMTWCHGPIFGCTQLRI